MKKICYVTTVSLTVKAFILETAKYLAANTDWEITIICDGDEEFARSLPSNIRYIPVPMKRGISLSGIKSMWQLRKIFKREKFDLIQYSTPNASLYAAMAGKMAKVPVRLYCQWGIAYVGMSGLKRKIFKFVEKQVCRMSTWIEPDSHSNRAFSIDEGLYTAEKSSVVGAGSACGVKLDKFDIAKKEEYRKEVRERYKIADDTFVYGFVGRINKDKGTDELLYAYKKLLQDNPDSHLFMIGREEKTELLSQENFEWSKGSEKVSYTGPTTEVEKYLSAMDCYVLPSYREGFGLGTVEAEAMGVPVVVTDIPGPIDAIVKGETGLCVPKADGEALYEALVKIRTEDLATMSQKGYAFAVENFDQQKLFPMILEDRKRLLSE